MERKQWDQGQTRGTRELVQTADAAEGEEEVSAPAAVNRHRIWTRR